MKKFTALLIALLALIPASAHADEHPATLALVSGEVLAGSEIIIPLVLSLPTEANTLIFDIEYDPAVFRLVSATRGDYPMPDDAMCVTDTATDGRIAVGILCPTDGMTGCGTLMELRFHAAHNQIGVHLLRITIRECLYSPLDGEGHAVNISAINAEVRVLDPNASAALCVLRGIMGIMDIPDWGDADYNGVIDTEDVMWILRRALA